MLITCFLVINLTLRDFERNGLALDEEPRKRLKEIKQGLYFYDYNIL